MLKKILLVPILAVFLLINVAHAQDASSTPSILPGNPLHVFVTLSEGIGNLFTLNPAAKAQRYLDQAERRLSEAKALADKGEADLAEKATQAYEDTLAKAEDKAKGLSIAGDRDALLQHIADMTAKHTAVLRQVLLKVPEQAKEAIQKVIDKSSGTQPPPPATTTDLHGHLPPPPPPVSTVQRCGGNTTNPPQCSVGYKCAPEPGSHLPFGDVGGICVKDTTTTASPVANGGLCGAGGAKVSSWQQCVTGDYCAVSEESNGTLGGRCVRSGSLTDPHASDGSTSTMKGVACLLSNPANSMGIKFEGQTSCGYSPANPLPLSSGYNANSVVINSSGQSISLSDIKIGDAILLRRENGICGLGVIGGQSGCTSKLYFVQDLSR